jgi:hypothetical protein
MTDYELKNVPKTFHALFLKSRDLLANGKAEEAAHVFDLLPDKLGEISDVHFLKCDIARALGVSEQLGIHDHARSAIETGGVPRGASASELLFPARSPMECGGIQFDDTGDAASRAEVSMRQPRSQQAAPAPLPESDFERFDRELAAARQAENAKMERLAAAPVHVAPPMSIVERTNEVFTDPQQYAGEFADGLQAARERDYQAQQWSDATPYEPPVEPPAPPEPVKPSWLERFSIKAQPA